MNPAPDSSGHHSKAKPESLKGALLFLLAVCTILLVADFLELDVENYAPEELVTMNLTASEGPLTHRTHRAHSYLLKTQEFLGRFQVADEYVRFVKDHPGIENQLLSIRRGDPLQITIPRTSEKDLHSLYARIPLLELRRADHTLYSLADIQEYSSSSRSNLRLGAGFLWLLSFVGLLISKKSNPVT